MGEDYEHIPQSIDFHNPDKDHILKDIMEAYSRTVYLLAYSFVRDRGLAEDVTQEVFLKCYRHLDTYRADSSFKSWIYRIAINAAKDAVMKKSFKTTIMFPKLFFENLKKSDSSEETYLKRNDREELMKKVLSLPVKYREVIVLYYFQDFKTEEIADLLKMNSNTVKTRLTRARALLKEKIDYQKGEVCYGKRTEKGI